MSVSDRTDYRTSRRSFQQRASQVTIRVRPLRDGIALAPHGRHTQRLFVVTTSKGTREVKSDSWTETAVNLRPAAPRGGGDTEMRSEIPLACFGLHAKENHQIRSNGIARFPRLLAAAAARESEQRERSESRFES